MAWTEQDYQEIVARLMANSIGVNEVPNADKADDVTSLPAFKPSGSDSEASVVNYPLEFLKGEQGEPGIQGEPGKSFKVAGEYATLEALKSAVPDGSAVDGFMAVGTEAPYDYYAWVNGEWVSQGKIAGGNVIVLPREILDLTGRSSSEEIFATFGGIDKYKDLLEKLSANNYLVQIGEPSLGSLRHIYTLVEYSVKFASNKQSGALSLNIYNEDRQLRRLHFYLEDNGTTARCGEANTFQLVKDSDVLTKTNTSSFTPTGDYQPATKKYVDDIAYGKVIVVSDISKFLYSVNLNGTDAEQRIVDLFGSIDNFKNVVADILANHTRYYFHINNNPNNNCIELGCVNAWRANDSTSYELHFIITYFGNNPVKMFTNRISIISNDDNRESKVIIASLVNSDNINTLTKKTSAEYKAIGSKDNETMYAITDA